MRSEWVPPPELATFQVARFRLRLKAKEMLYLPAYKGSALRGGFGQVFRQIACLEANRGFGECPLGERCPYHYIFETPPPAGSVILDKVPTAPQPFVRSDPSSPIFSPEGNHEESPLHQRNSILPYARSIPAVPLWLRVFGF